MPHFEKMLYDNALLAVAYLEGYQATGRADFARRRARRSCDYVERDMTSPEGAFYSATDADSLGARRPARGRLLLHLDARRRSEPASGPDGRGSSSAYYGVTPAGNFEGRSILHVAAAARGRRAASWA